MYRLCKCVYGDGHIRYVIEKEYRNGYDVGWSKYKSYRFLWLAKIKLKQLEKLEHKDEATKKIIID
jgi:hypothetical protein